MPWASSAARSFSQTRGTEPHTVGRTEGSTATIWVGSSTQVTSKPSTIHQ